MWHLLTIPQWTFCWWPSHLCPRGNRRTSSHILYRERSPGFVCNWNTITEPAQISVHICFFNRGKCRFERRTMHRKADYFSNIKYRHAKQLLQLHLWLTPSCSFLTTLTNIWKSYLEWPLFQSNIVTTSNWKVAFLPSVFTAQPVDIGHYFNFIILNFNFVKDPTGPIANSNLATSWENMIVPYTNNKGADQPPQEHSLISAFIIHSQNSVIVVDIKINVWGVSEMEMTGLRLDKSKTSLDKFSLMARLICGILLEHGSIYVHQNLKRWH